MDELEFQAQFRPSGPVTLTDVLTRRLATPDRDELADAAAAERRKESAARQREELMMANRAAGDPIGQVSRAQAAVSELRGEVAGLENQLEAARGRLNLAASNLIHWSDEADAIRTAIARSGEPGDMLTDAKRALDEARAAERVDRMLAERSARGPARRPKGRGGLAVRSNQPVTCRDCIAVGASPEESWLLHADPDAAIETELVGLSEKALAAFGRLEVPESERQAHAGAVIRR